MSKFVRPTINGEFFTGGKLYKVQHELSKDRVIVINDEGDEVVVRVDGKPSVRLAWVGKFERVNMQEEKTLQSTIYEMRIGIGRGKGWRMLKDGGIEINDAKISDGQIYASASPSNEYAEVLQQLREILRVPEGESILTHAKVVRVLADGLINLQK